MTLTFGSLFAGIGGLDLGLEWAGMRCAWQVEKDDFCQQVLTKHWPDVPKFGDIYDCGKHNLTPVDVICGGFPCQPFSQAGKRGGTDDDRYLWPEMLRIITEIKPRYVIGENVPGIITLALDEVLASLEDAGYTTETFVIPAVAVDAPHRRDRVWIMAYTESNLWQASGDGIINSFNGTGEIMGHPHEPKLAQWESQPGNPRPKQQAIKRNGDIMADANEPRPQRRNGAGLCECADQWVVGARGASMADATGERLQNRYAGQISRSATQQRLKRCSCSGPTGWLPEPGVGRVADGVPRRVDRLRALGNAVVPQLAQAIGEILIQFDEERL